MTVSQLIEKLGEFPPEMEVVVDAGEGDLAYPNTLEQVEIIPGKFWHTLAPYRKVPETRTMVYIFAY